MKSGGARLNALLTVTARSLLMDGMHATKKLLWGVYPSSNSDNGDHEVLSEFTHRLRTTVSGVQHCKRGEPLFIRHTPALKRSAGGQSRLDPTNQIESLHLNPVYKTSLPGKNVVLIDDCTTYGASFGVATAFLRSGGAASVTGVALGKFGEQLREFKISIAGDPFKPVTMSQVQMGNPEFLSGSTSGVTQSVLRDLIP